MTRLTTEDAAYCAAAWASGEKQKDLAPLFGLKTTTPISLAIRAFLNAYVAPDALQATRYRPDTNRGDLMFDRCIYGDERKSLVPGALRAFQRSRG
jgi:hypothetical protein